VIWERAVAENAWELDNGLYRILLPLPFAVPFVNVYVVASCGEFVLFDAGSDWLPSLRALGRALKAIGVPPHGLTSLVLTHQHPDHGGGAPAIHERWGGRVFLHPAENSERPITSEEVWGWMAENGADEASMTRATAARERPPLATLPVEDLDETRPFVVGDLRFEVILAAGHSPGQVMLREPHRGWLFTADHLIQVHGVNVWAFPTTPGDPFGEYVANLARSYDLKANLILPSHGLPWRGDVKETVRDLLAFHQEFLGRVLSEVGVTPRTAWDITRSLRTEIPTDPIGIRFSLAEVLAALVHLERSGRARRGEAGRWSAIEA
jgi:glyoxylase-like metal-dependent hydrolase (beta-lactamase superfamily II)